VDSEDDRVLRGLLGTHLGMVYTTYIHLQKMVIWIDLGVF
jgi:hypothetical protein